MSENWVPKKPNFGPPPPGYIAGLGRGATGFITRSDLGPAKAPAGTNIKQLEIDQTVYADSKYDSWQGYNIPLFGKNNLDEQDRQAEDAYDFCQKKMDERRLKQRQKLIEQIENNNKKQTKTISQKFVDIKRQLGTLTYQDWQKIPQAVDLSIKKRKKQKYVPVPDSLLTNLLADKINNSHTRETNQDFRDAKQILLKTKLDKAQSNNVVQKSTIDKIGYLTQLNSNKIEGQFIGDVKRARVLLKSALMSNPKNSDIWISAARVEELDGKLQVARQLLHKGIESCPESQDLWLQASRLEKPQESQLVLIEGLKKLPTSQKIWLAAARKQDSNIELKSKILRKGLENIPQSTKLWKQLIQIENIEQAKKLLYKAVECLPKQIDLWIGLAKIQTYQNAKKVLNQARKSNPLNFQIWINAAKLQQTQSDQKNAIKDKIEAILLKGRQILIKNGNKLSRNEWIEQALMCQKSNNLLTCEMIIKISISYGIIQQDQLNVFIKDADIYEKQYDSIYTTRYIYQYGVIESKSKDLLARMIDFQRRLELDNKPSAVKQAIQIGIKLFPGQVQFWSLMIDKFINDKQYDNAIDLINKASQSLEGPQRQQISLKKITILKIENKFAQARTQLQILRQLYKGQRSYLQSIKLQYELKLYQTAWKLCQNFFKQSKLQQIWIYAFKIKSKIGTYNQCKTLIEKGIQKFGNCLQLWKLYVDFQIDQDHINKARAIIDKALLKLPKRQEIHLMSIDLQLKYGELKQANFALAKALKVCSKSGQLWGYAIQLQSNQNRKKKANIALEQCGQNCYIYCSVGKTFWKENKLDKAKKWLQNAVELSLTNGDIWSYYFKFIMEKYPQEAQAVSHRFHSVGSINQGRKWINIAQSDEGWKMSQQQILLKLISNIN